MSSIASLNPDETASAKPPTREVLRVWCRHLASLAFPGSALLFLWTGPHPWYIAPIFIAPSVLMMMADAQPDDELRQPDDSFPAWPFDAILYLLAVMQFAVVLSLASMFASQSIFSLDMIVTIVIVGGSSGFSIITAHELIHRRSKFDQALGRALLCTVLYEHFYTEHLRGHHVLVGTHEDPATARFGETYGEFWRRTVPAQFVSAWRIESRRLGEHPNSFFNLLRNRMLHGIVAGWTLALVIGLTWGPAAFVAHLVQAFMAVRSLEAVNYFEHWGLSRKKRRVRPVDSWDAYGRFTYYGLTGLARHADHHAWPARPFQQLRAFEDAPRLPTGYVGMVDLVMGNNNEFRSMATRELERRNLGPFEDTRDPAERAALVQKGYGEQWPGSRAPIAALSGLWSRLPPWFQPLVFLILVVLGVTAGAHFEASATTGFGARLAVNAWIIVVFATVLFGRWLIVPVVRSQWAAWILALATLVLVGGLSDAVLAG